MFAREKAARVRAEAAERRAAFLDEVSRALATSLDYKATLVTVAQLAVPYLADWCAVDIVEDDGTLYRLAIAHIDPARIESARELQRRYPLDPNAPYGSVRVIRTRQPEIYTEVTDTMLVAVAQDAEHLRRLRQAGLKSGMCVPLIARSRVVGALSFGSTQTSSRYGPADLSLAEDIARHAAVAIDNARLYHEAKQNEARKAAVLEAAFDCIITVNDQGRVIEFNPAAERTFGVSRSDAIGRDIAELFVPPSLRDHHRRGLAGAVAGGVGGLIGRRTEMTAVRRDGSEFPAEIAVARISSDGPSMFTAYIRDMTEHKRAEEIERQTQALKSVARLANAAAHEINNPLTVLQLSLTWLAEDGYTDAGGHQRIERALEAVDRIQDIVARMGRITRLEVVPPSPHIPEMLDLRRSSEAVGGPEEPG